MTIKGVVSSIVFVNKENGYTVFSILCKEESTNLTCVGTIPIVSVGEDVELVGEFTVHPKFGEQFIVSRAIISSPKTADGIFKYLSSGLIKGIGEVTARALVAKFGEHTLDIMLDQPQKLTAVKGVSQTKAISFSNALAELRQMQTHIMFLQSYNISTNTAIKIYSVYKDKTTQVVTANPFILIDDVDGIGFITADKIAQNMGIEPTSNFRIRAAVIYCLKEAADKQGNTALAATQLYQSVVKLLQLDEDIETRYEGVIDLMLMEVDIKKVEINQIECICLNKYYVIERSVAALLVGINNQAYKLGLNLDVLVEEFERINNLKFHINQVEAIKRAVSNGICVITGGPGTGKTTIIKCIAHIFNSQGLKVMLCAPTGRASKRLSQATGQSASTIHRLLGMEYSSGRLNFLYNADNPINCDCIIVDELSMVDVNLMNNLLKAVKKGCRVIMVGDKDQLPSVGAGNVLGDIIASGLIDVCYLTYIYRQSLDSLIVSNAHLINQCHMPIVDNESKDFFLVSATSNEDTAEKVKQLVSTRLPTFTNVKPFDIQVLAPLKGGVAGVNNINLSLQQLLNPPMPRKGEITFGNITFRCGDKVMQTVNDYEMQWTKYNDDGTVENGDGVFNGDIGVITQINSGEGYTEVTFDDDRVSQYLVSDLANLLLAYAITIHKSQGCEFDVVVIPLTSGAPTILNKNLLYTAVTRAKKVVVLVCNKKHLAMMVHNNYAATRLTNLPQFLIEEDVKYKSLYS